MLARENCPYLPLGSLFKSFFKLLKRELALELSYLNMYDKQLIMFVEGSKTLLDLLALFELL